MFQFLMQRVHMLIFTLVIMGAFLSIYSIVTAYGVQSEHNQRCANVVSAMEGAYAGGGNVTINYSLGISGNLSTFGSVLSINGTEKCSKSFTTPAAGNKISFNNYIVITSNEGMVEISG